MSGPTQLGLGPSRLRRPLRAAVCVLGGCVAVVAVLVGAIVAIGFVLASVGRVASPGRRRGRRDSTDATPQRDPVDPSSRRPLLGGPVWPAMVALVALVALAAPIAAAHFNGTANSSISTATGPMERAVTYPGGFGSPDDVDYYYFTTTRDNVSLHFTVRNTLSSCPGNSFCQLYATLIDTTGNQLGGEGSSAGTGPVGYAGSGYSTDSIDWTFGAAGRYILVFDSDGDLPAYQFRIDPADGVTAGTPASPAPTPIPAPVPGLPAPALPAPPLSALSLTKLSLSPTRFRAATKGASIAAKKPKATGTKVSYTLNRAATTTFTITRVLPGVRKGKACVAPPRTPDEGTKPKKCTRARILGAFTRASTAGSNSFRFAGRLKKTLSPGAYKLTATAKDTVGNTSPAATKAFTIAR